MMNTNQLFEQLIAGHHLTPPQMHEIIKNCMNGTLTDVQIATFLALMRMKGETIDELTVAAATMQAFAREIDLGEELIDIVGTGGDGKNTFNVSTVSSFVVAASGLKVAKHGNYSASSRSGSADFLLQAGFKLNLSDRTLQHCIKQCSIAFLFAPHFHQALQHVKNARQQLGLRTLFNLLGPLLNPARAKKQVVGVYDNRWLKPLAHVLANLGSEHAMVLNARDGLDEISIAAITDVIEYKKGTFSEWTIDPKDYGCAYSSLDEIIVASPQESLAIAESIFAGHPGPARDMILLNSAAALYCADVCTTFSAAIEQVVQVIDSGLPAARFAQLRALTQTDQETYE